MVNAQQALASSSKDCTEVSAWLPKTALDRYSKKEIQNGIYRGHREEGVLTQDVPSWAIISDANAFEVDIFISIFRIIHRCIISVTVSNDTKMTKY